MTKVQKEVMARFDKGERLIILPTRRASGDAIFWVRQYTEGWCIVEKALYPQLRLLFWYGEIGDAQMLPSDTPIVGGTWYLEREGVVGY
jgi:hypothetical protein